MNNIKRLRKEKGFSVTALADAVNISQSNLTKIENGQVELKPELVEKIAAVLQVSTTAVVQKAPSADGVILLQVINPEIIGLPPLAHLPILEHLCPNLPQETALYVMEDDTMTPHITPNSLVVVDKNHRDFSQNGIYLLRINERLALRRLQRALNQKINLLSDNASYPPEQMDEADLNIIGKAFSVVLYQNL